MKAKIYLANKLYEQAIEFAKQAITLAPDNNEYYTFIADIYYKIINIKMHKSIIEKQLNLMLHLHI